MDTAINSKAGVIAVACIVLTTAACLGSDDAEADDKSATVRFHPLMHYCVTYELSGMMTGSWVECSRKYGNERYEIQNTEVKVGPFTQSDNKRVVYLGPKIYSIPEKGIPTVAENPLYEGMATRMKDVDAMELSESLLSSMGFTPTGETREILNRTCNVAAGPVGSMCMTDDGLMLIVDAMGQTRTAVAIDLDSGGDDANYAIPDNVKEAPDLSKIMQGLGN